MAVGPTLVTAIEKWMDGKRSRTLGMLARLSNVSYSTVRRAAQGEGEPSQQVALDLASVVMAENEFREFVGSHWPALRRFVVDVNYKRGEESLHAFLNSEGHFKVIVLASGHDGTTEEEVKAKFGESHLSYLEDLIDSGFLTSKASGSWAFDREIGDVSMGLARKCLASLAGIADPKNDKIDGASTAWVGWESLSADAAVRCNNVLAKAIEELFSIFNDKANRGDVLVYAGALLNVLKGQEKLR